MTQESDLMARIFELCEQGKGLSAKYNALDDYAPPANDSEANGLGYLRKKLDDACVSNDTLVREALSLLGRIAPEDVE